METTSDNKNPYTRTAEDWAADKGVLPHVALEAYLARYGEAGVFVPGTWEDARVRQTAPSVILDLCARGARAELQKAIEEERYTYAEVFGSQHQCLFEAARHNNRDVLIWLCSHFSLGRIMGYRRLHDLKVACLQKGHTELAAWIETELGIGEMTSDFDGYVFPSVPVANWD